LLMVLSMFAPLVIIGKAFSGQMWGSARMVAKDKKQSDFVRHYAAQGVKVLSAAVHIDGYVLILAFASVLLSMPVFYVLRPMPDEQFGVFLLYSALPSILIVLLVFLVSALLLLFLAVSALLGTWTRIDVPFADSKDLALAKEIEAEVGE